MVTVKKNGNKSGDPDLSEFTRLLLFGGLVGMTCITVYSGLVVPLMTAPHSHTAPSTLLSPVVSDSLSAEPSSVSAGAGAAASPAAMSALLSPPFGPAMTPMHPVDDPPASPRAVKGVKRLPSTDPRALAGPLRLVFADTRAAAAALLHSAATPLSSTVAAGAVPWVDLTNEELFPPAWRSVPVFAPASLLTVPSLAAALPSNPLFNSSLRSGAIAARDACLPDADGVVECFTPHRVANRSMWLRQPRATYGTEVLPAYGLVHWRVQSKADPSFLSPPMPQSFGAADPTDGFGCYRLAQPPLPALRAALAADTHRNDVAFLRWDHEWPIPASSLLKEATQRDSPLSSLAVMDVAVAALSLQNASLSALQFGPYTKSQCTAWCERLPDCVAVLHRSESGKANLSAASPQKKSLPHFCILLGRAELAPRLTRVLTSAQQKELIAANQTFEVAWERHATEDNEYMRIEAFLRFQQRRREVIVPPGRTDSVVAWEAEKRLGVMSYYGMRASRFVHNRNWNLGESHLWSVCLPETASGVDRSRAPSLSRPQSSSLSASTGRVALLLTGTLLCIPTYLPTFRWLADAYDMDTFVIAMLRRGQGAVKVLLRELRPVAAVVLSDSHRIAFVSATNDILRAHNIEPGTAGHYFGFITLAHTLRRLYEFRQSFQYDWIVQQRLDRIILRPPALSLPGVAIIGGPLEDHQNHPLVLNTVAANRLMYHSLGFAWHLRNLTLHPSSVNESIDTNRSVHPSAPFLHPNAAFSIAEVALEYAHFAVTRNESTFWDAKMSFSTSVWKGTCMMSQDVYEQLAYWGATYPAASLSVCFDYKERGLAIDDVLQCSCQYNVAVDVQRYPSRVGCSAYPNVLHPIVTYNNF